MAHTPEPHCLGPLHSLRSSKKANSLILLGFVLFFCNTLESSYRTYRPKATPKSITTAKEEANGRK